MVKIKNLENNEPYLYKDMWVRGIEEEYIIKEQNTYKKLHIIEGDTVLDIGGHIGCSARYFVTKGAKAVYSYEPMPSNFKLLQMNSVGYNIFPIRAAVIEDDRKEIELFTPRTRFTTEHSVVNKRGRTSTTVPAVNFANAVRLANPSVMKLDIEGGELNLLPWFANQEIMSGIRSIAMEIHYYEHNSREIANCLKDIMFRKYIEVQPPKYLDGGWNRCTAIWERK